METKQCSICGLEKPLTDFAFRDKKEGIYRANCRKCQSDYASRRYYFNKEILDKTKEGKSCVRCGYSECVEALDYHHIDPTTKKDTVARLLTHYNVEDGLKEIEKCVLLCANCHRLYHFLEKKKGITLEDFISM